MAPLAQRRCLCLPTLIAQDTLTMTLSSATTVILASEISLQDLLLMCLKVKLLSLCDSFLIIVSLDLGRRGGVAEELKKTGRIAGIVTLVIFVVLVSL